MNNILAPHNKISFEDELKDGNFRQALINSDSLKYKWPNDFIKDDNIDMKVFNLYIDKISDDLIQSDATPYSESNSGFNIINVVVDFIKKSDKYIPQIRFIYPSLEISWIKNKNYQDEFSKKYYNFLFKNIINPHFGFSTEAPDQPIRCIINTELDADNNIITADIISKLFLKFDKKRTKVEIYLDVAESQINSLAESHINSLAESQNNSLAESQSNSLAESQSNIGHINLNIDNIDIIILTHIELLPQYRKKNIAVNVLFVLMETLASYYAPLNISLKMAFLKQMHNIAYALKFHKAHSMAAQKEEYYIRLCRI